MNPAFLRRALPRVLFLLACILGMPGCLDFDLGKDDKKSPGNGPALQLLVNHTVVARGDTVILTWNAPGADVCIASGDWEGSSGNSGEYETWSLSEIGRLRFGLTCYSTSGATTREVLVDVIEPPSLTFTASLPDVAAGESVTLDWSSAGATACTASGAWSGPRATQGAEEVTVSAPGDNSYTLTCTNGRVDARRTVTIFGLVPELSLTVDRTHGGVGSDVTLTLATAYADNCVASGDWSGSLPLGGTLSAKILRQGTNTFTATCSNAGSTTTSSVSVTGDAMMVNLAAFPLSVEAGQSLTLTWSTNAGGSCVASGDWSGTRLASGTESVTIASAGAKTFRLDCANTVASAGAQVQVNAAPAPLLPMATAYKITPDHRGEINFSGGIVFPAAPAWSVQLSGTASYPLIAEGKVFLTATGTSSGTGYGTRLHALNAQTGAAAWPAVDIPGTYFWSAATYEDGRVFVMNYDGLLRAFNAADGTPLWTTDLPGQYAFDAPPTAYQGTVYVGGAGSGGTLYAVDATTGSVRWTRSVANGNTSSPAVTSSGVYVTYPCQAYAFAPADGKALWHRPGACSGGGGRTSVAANGKLYARYWDFSNRSKVIEMDALTGAGTTGFDSQRLPAVTGTSIYTLNGSTLRALAAADLSVRWTYTGDNQLNASPIVVNGFVIVGSGTGYVYALNAATGAVAWQGAAGAGVPATDEQNVSQPTTGIAAGEGLLVVPAGSRITAWKLTP